MTNNKYKKILEHKKLPLYLVVLALIISLPTLWSGFFLDDYDQQYKMRHVENANLFEFGGGDPDQLRVLLDRGLLPWWTNHDMKVKFMRPVASWLIYLDYEFWPDNAMLMHAHSILWYCLAIYFATCFYQRSIDSRKAAGLAALLFCIDGGHGAAVGWLANRNIIVAITAAFICLNAYKGSRARDYFIGWASFTFGLLSGEAGIALSAYLFSYAVFIDKSNLMKRSLRLAPYVVIAALWLLYRSTHGYGVSNSEIYIDPISEAGTFYSHFIYRYPINLTAQLFLPFAEVLHYLPNKNAVLFYCLTVLSLLYFAFLPLIRTSKWARFFLLGMLLSAIPICSSMPLSRSLWFVGIGGCGLLGLFISGHKQMFQKKYSIRAASLLAKITIFFHIILQVPAFIGFPVAVKLLDESMTIESKKIPMEIEGDKLLFLTTGNYYADITYPFIKLFLDKGLSPQIARGLIHGEVSVSVSRPEEDMLIIESQNNMEIPLSSKRFPLPSGYKTTVKEMDVEVIEATEGIPTKIAFTFSPKTLESYKPYSWANGYFVETSLPEVGEKIILGRTDYYGPI